MFRLSKKVEYGILAVQYMASHPNDLLTVKDIAGNLDLSFEFMSKSMQTLTRKGIVNSQQGIKGGYALAINPDKITIMDIIRAFDEKISIVECFDASIYDCNRTDNCSLRNPLNILQKKVENIFHSTTISDLSRNEINNIEYTKNNNFIKLTTNVNTGN